MESLRATTVRNLYYQGTLTGAAALAGAAAVLVLARVLSPADYGLAMFAFLVVQAAEMVADFGITAAVLSRRDELQATVQAAATLRVVLSAAASGALALLALSLAGPLGGSAFSPYLLPLSALPLVTGLGFASQAQLRLDLDFRRLSIAQSGGMVGSPVAQTALALSGFGVWSIVWGALLGHLLQFALLTAVRPMFFRPAVDLKAWRRLLSFGSKVIGMGLLSSAYELTVASFVSAFAGAAALGGFLLGVRVATLVPQRAMTIMSDVLLPTISKIRAGGGDVARAYLEAVRLVALPAAFANFAAVALAVPGVLLIGGLRWEGAALSVQVMALFGILQAATSPGTPFVQMRGRPGASLKSSAASYALLWALGLPALWAAGLPGFLLVLLGIMAFAWAFVGSIVHGVGGPPARLAAAAAWTAVAPCALAGAFTLALVALAPVAPLTGVAAGACLYGALALTVDRAAFGGANVERVLRFARLALAPTAVKSP